MSTFQFQVKSIVLFYFYEHNMVHYGLPRVDNMNVEIIFHTF